MRLHDSRLFVGGLAPGTGDADLRGHGEVGQIWLPQPDSRICRPRLFAFVQFLNPNDAGRALADAHHAINGRQVRVGRARRSEQVYFTPLSQRVYRSGRCCHRVGDTITISFGPLSEQGDDERQGDECVKQVRPFGRTTVHGALLFDCVIGYISEDGKECLVRWPPVQPGQHEQSQYDAAMRGQGKIVLGCECPLKDLAEDCSAAAQTTTGAGATQSFRWIVFKGRA